jgi:tetratricopeptide (TPR) repeat protein
VRTDGVIALLSGHPDQAFALFEQVRRLSDRPVSDSYLALAYFYYGERARAEATLDTLSRSSSASAAARAKAALASFVAARGDRNRAQALLREVTGGSYMDHHVAYSIGAVYAQLGQLGEARRWLSQAAQTGFPCAGWFAWDPLLQPLRGDPGFEQLLREAQGTRDRVERAEETRAAKPES